MVLGVRLGCACLVLAVGTAAAQVVFTVRVLPRPLGTNLEPFRIGLQTGFPERSVSPLGAERLAEETMAAEAQVTVRTLRDPETGQRRYWVANEGEKAGGVVLTTAPLRKGESYTVRVRCRTKENSTVRLSFAPVGGGVSDRTEKVSSVRGGDVVEKSFAVKPHKDGAFECAFQLSPGGLMELGGFSMLPEDAAEGWDSQALEALRTVNPGVLRWPDERAARNYNWYGGVGPQAARTEAGQSFGTVEFAGFCRLVGAQPLVRVTVFQPGSATGGTDTLEAGVQRAADWVAYCNAPSNQPLGALRARHGHADPLGVGAWELALPAGVKPEAAGHGAACRMYAAAMREADPSTRVGAGLEPGDAPLVSNVLQQAGDFLDFVSCGAPGAREAVEAFNRSSGRRVAWADTRLEGVRDRYVAEVMSRLEAGDAQERAYYAGWYGALSVMNAALRGMRGGCGPVCSPYTPEHVLARVTYAKRMLTETGLLLALVNRFPAKVPLLTEGAPSEALSPFQVVAAWTEDDSALAVYVYNSGTDARTVRLDLTALERRFAFWASEQLAADIAAPRQAQTVPVTRKMKAGAALTQVVLCTSQPASFTRIIVKE